MPDNPLNSDSKDSKNPLESSSTHPKSDSQDALLPTHNRHTHTNAGDLYEPLDWDGQTTDESRGEIRIQDYIFVILKRKWLILLCFILVVTCTILHVSKQKPLYRASARVMIGGWWQSSTHLGSARDVALQNYYELANLDTVCLLIQSPEIANKLFQNEKLMHDPKLLALAQRELQTVPSSSSNRLTDTIEKWVKTLIPTTKPDTDQSSDENHNPKSELKEPYRTVKKIISGYLAKIKVERVENTRLVDIICSGGDPDLVAKIVNAYVSAFTEWDLEKRMEATEKRLKWLEERFTVLRANVSQSEDNVLNFKEEKGLLLEDKISLIGSTLKKKGEQLIETQNNLDNDKRLLEQIEKLRKKNLPLDVIPEFMEDKELISLSGELDTLREELTKLRRDKNYGDQHPNVLKFQELIEDTKTKIQGRIDRLVEAVKIRYEQEQSTKEYLESELKKQQELALQLERWTNERKKLEREAETSQKIYDQLLSNIKDTELISSAANTSNVYVVKGAIAPHSPYSPNKPRTILMGIIIGLAGGVGLAFLLEFFDNSIRGIDDIEKHLKLPFLGTVARFPISDNGSSNSALVTMREPKSDIAEAFRNVRTNLIFSSSASNAKRILITSAAPSEGKTTVSSNVAITMAQFGKQVLLVDSDMRKPKVHTLFGLERDPGVSNFLVGDKKLDEIIKDTNELNLKVITCGPIPPNPSELIGSPHFKTFLDQISKQFDFVIFDSPPIVSATDPIILSNWLDGVALIVKGGETARGVVKRVTQQLKEVNSNVLGIILNDIDFRKQGYYYYSKYYNYYKYYSYYHYYRYGYGYGYNYNREEDDKKESPRNRKRKGILSKFHQRKDEK